MHLHTALHRMQRITKAAARLFSKGSHNIKHVPSGAVPWSCVAIITSCPDALPVPNPECMCLNVSAEAMCCCRQHRAMAVPSSGKCLTRTLARRPGGLLVSLYRHVVLTCAPGHGRQHAGRTNLVRVFMAVLLPNQNAVLNDFQAVAETTSGHEQRPKIT